MLAHARSRRTPPPPRRASSRRGARPLPDNDIYKKAAPGEYWPSGLTGAGPQAEFSMGDWGWRTDPGAASGKTHFTVDGFRGFFNSAYGDDIDRHDIVYSTVFFLLYLVHWLVKPFFTSGSHFSTKYDSLLFTSLLLPLVMLALPALAPKLFGMATRKLGGGRSCSSGRADAAPHSRIAAGAARRGPSTAERALRRRPPARRPSPPIDSPRSTRGTCRPERSQGRRRGRTRRGCCGPVWTTTREGRRRRWARTASTATRVCGPP